MRAFTAGVMAVALAFPVAGLAGSSSAAPPAPAAAAPQLPAGFQDTVAIANLSEATSVAFVPTGPANGTAGGTAFVALKPGIIQAFDYDAGTGTFEGTGSVFANLSTNVNNYWDRGLTGIEVDPQFPTRPYVYVNYTYDRDPRDNPPQVPKWGEPGGYYDECQEEASVSPVRVGCLVTVRVSRLTAVMGAGGWVMQAGSERELVQDACIQFGSHASGDVLFGPDGFLYASAGEGAAFTTADWGQAGNPCPGDPPNGLEGGSLRSQDYQTTPDALGLGGSVFRVHPDTGAAPDGSTANASRMVAYGQRNPWRLAFRSPTGPERFELWSGDVGSSTWEEVNRIPDVRTLTTPVNRGWPCYEGSFTGSARQSEWDALNRPICENLYAQGPGAVVAPYFSYQTRGPLLTPGEDCQNDTSSVSGIAFGSASSNYPDAYQGSLFFTDFARSCIWRLGKKQDGTPDPTSITPFVQAAETPTDLLVGPGGDLYYVDYGLNAEGVPTANAGAVHRITYTSSNAAPTARIVADKVSGPAPLTVSFDGTTSSDPDPGDVLTYAWDLDGDGQYDDSTAARPTRTYQVGNVTVRLRVDDGHGHQATASQLIQAGNTEPVIGAMTPAGTLTWKVDDTIGFSASATDAQDGTLPPSAFSWNVALRHCPSGNCHTHSHQSYAGVSSGSFTAPDHEYPSHLLVTVTVTDSQGLTASRTVQVNPQSVTLGFASNPPGAALTVDSEALFAPASRDFIVGHSMNLIAPAQRQYNGADYTFASWSDGVTTPTRTGYKAPASATTLTANYVLDAPANQPPTAAVSASPSSGPAPLTPTLSAAGSTDPESGPLTYAWDLDDDGLYDDATGVTTSLATFRSVGPHPVRVRVTDNAGANATASTTVTVTNTAPTATVTTTPSPASGTAPLAVSFSAASTTDPNPGDTFTYAWDLDGDGTFETLGTPTPPQRTYGVGTTTVRLRVTDNHGDSDTDAVTVTAANTAPSVTSVSPAAGTTWSVGQTIGYSATANDPQETLPPSAYTWRVERQDCATGCARTTVTTSTGPAGSFVVPEMAYPSHLFLTVTVTDTQGLTATATRQLEPRTADLTFATTPTGGVTTVSGTDHVAPWTGTFVVGAQVPVSVPATRVVGGANHGFTAWSDGGARSHTVTVPASATTYTASYTRQNRLPTAVVTANPTSGPTPLAVQVSATATDPDGDDTTFTYAWDLDDDGAYDDATGATASATYTGLGAHEITVRVTDAHGGSSTTSTNVTVTNSGPTARITTTPSPPTGNAPLPVTFSGATSSDPDGGALAYAWDLDGDGQYDDGSAPTANRTYQVGTVTVGLRVTDSDQASSTASVQVSAPNRNPVAAVSADPSSGPAPLQVALSAAGSADPDGTALGYAWDLDDDGAYDDATGPTASATFTGVGGHRVGVRVTDADNGTGTASTTVTVTNSGPTAVIVTDPASGSGPAPLTVSFDGSTSQDPDGGPLTYAWDLDDDGQYDDATGATATGVYPVGTLTTRLRVTDQHGSSAVAARTITATNSAPTLTRVTAYPSGGYRVGQTLGFDAAGTDPQQALPATAFSFTMLRQDCRSGCPRVEVQRWTGTSTGRFVVPPMPYPSRLFLVATVTDAHGATATRELRLEPVPVRLKLRTSGPGLSVKVDGVVRRSGWSGRVVAGSRVRLSAPRLQVRGGVRWTFVRWSDGGARRHELDVWDPKVTLRAIYRRS